MEAETLGRSSLYGGLNGLGFAPDGTLYVANAVGGFIILIDPETGAPQGMLGPDVGVINPDDLIFGPDGSLYWTNIITGEVGRRAPDGTTTLQFVSPGVNPITFSEDGRLFVAADFYGDGLWELDPELVDPPELLIETLGWLNGFDFGPDGLLYGPIWTEQRVVKIDVDAQPPTIETVTEIPAAAVKFDSQDRLHAVDSHHGEVVRIDAATGAVDVVAVLEQGLDNLAFDATDRLFVSSFVDGFLVEVLADGTSRTVVPGGFIGPAGVAVEGRVDGESAFVSDFWTMRELDGETGEERAQTASDFSDFCSLDRDGDRFVSGCWLNDQVRVWDRVAGGFVETHTDFLLPIDAVFFDGGIVVSELGADAAAPRVARMSGGEVETLMDAADGLMYPAGLAATADDLWVGDWATGMVWQLVADGTVLDPPTPVAQGLVMPEGMAVDLDGTLLVAETGAQRLARVDPASGSVTPVIGGLQIGMPAPPGFPPSLFLTDVAVGPSGAIYVTSDLMRSLYKLVAKTIYVPAAAHVAGSAGTSWMTDLEVHNGGETSAGFTVELLPLGGDNSIPRSVNFSVAPGTTAEYRDALDEIFEFRGTAALRLATVGEGMLVSSKTYNDQPGGTYGQFIPGSFDTEAVAAGEEVRLLHLRHSPGTGDGYRTNIGFANACGSAMTVEIALYTSDGAMIGENTVSLQPFEYRQLNNVFGGTGAGEVSGGFAMVTSASPGARYFAYASIVDNLSGDAIFVPAR
ncbi:MAG: hypothetical protein V2I67_13000 [Thermoanaerobaculales bacterium]|nr:hypothetical protein [Thermoanaerobaculales bacterium]